MKHALSRTSPKGGPFLGKCFKCGREDIPLSDNTECVNPAAITDDEALIIAIEGRPDDH
jgi:hypothetical protein